MIFKAGPLLDLQKSFVTVSVVYWMPDYRNILNEFIWQTEDHIPEYPRLLRFLNHWKDNVCAPISEVRIMNGPLPSWRAPNIMLSIN